MQFQCYDAVLYQKLGNLAADAKYDIIGAITGFSPSMGALVLTGERSAIFVDGRYTLAAHQTVNKNRFDILDLQKNEILSWIRKNIPANGVIAYDADLFSMDDIRFFKKALHGYRFVEIDLCQELQIRATPKKLKLINVPADNSVDKFAYVYAAIERHNLDAYILCNACSIAWLLDFRDVSEKYTPVFSGYLLVTKSYGISLYSDDICPANLAVKKMGRIAQDVSTLRAVGIDMSAAPEGIHFNNLVNVKDPCLLPRSIKSATEAENIRSAAKRDSEVLVNFLHWFHNLDADISEMDVVNRLHFLRSQQPEFVCESFETIAAADDHAAIVHYAPTSSSNKKIQNILLLDSGGQYKYGTTDITRTISLKTPSSKERLYYTLVLKGHIALADAKFPVGTTGSQLEVLARQFLWQQGYDYPHSTGHGIGYMLNVHEGPIGISKNNHLALVPNMLLSNEPGYYSANNFGIRLENMMFVKKILHECLTFDIVSLVPFDNKFIELGLLTEAEKKWLTKYHEKILSLLTLDATVKNWLKHQIRI